MSTSKALTPEEYLSMTMFMYSEAQLLDNQQWSAWGELLAADIDYRVPVRLTVDRSAAAFSSDAFHMIESLASLKTRIARLNARSSHAENPPTRSRRFVTNVRASESATEGEWNVISNLLLYRERGDAPPDTVSAERHDVLRASGGGYLIAKRLVHLDQTLLRTHNLIFL